VFLGFSDGLEGGCKTNMYNALFKKKFFGLVIVIVVLFLFSDAANADIAPKNIVSNDNGFTKTMDYHDGTNGVPAEVIIKYILGGGRLYAETGSAQLLHILVALLICFFMFSLGILVYNMFLRAITKKQPLNESRQSLERNNIGLAGFGLVCLLLSIFIVFPPSGQKTKTNGDDYWKNFYKNEYDNSILIGTTIDEYIQTTVVPIFDTKNVIAFDSKVIPIPFDLANKDVESKDNLLVIHQDSTLLFAVFAEGATTWPELKSDLRSFLTSLITSTYGSSSYDQDKLGRPYSKKIAYLNTVPVVDEDGFPDSKVMSSQAISFKKKLEEMYRYNDELSIMYVNIQNSSINCILFQTPIITKIEIYNHDLLDYTIVFPTTSESNEYVDYILTYLDTVLVD